jgi:hypothetical protein
MISPRLRAFLFASIASLPACAWPEAEPDVERPDAAPGGGKRDGLDDVSLAEHRCEVLVAGGSTAALAAALTSAREGATTCLLEPTDWIGGQLTASAVPAIDFAWHKVGSLDVGAIAKDPANLPQEFVAWMDELGNPGNCWVSKNCFRPDLFHERTLLPTAAAEPNLHLFLNTVVKDVVTSRGPSGEIIEQVVAIRRHPRTADDPRLSEQIEDWYDPADSERFDKEMLRFGGKPDLVVIDATEFGDVLVLAGAPYLQGVEVLDGSTEIADDTCGQATVFPFVMRYHTGPRFEPSVPEADRPEVFDLGRFTWDQVFTYRRIVDQGQPGGLYGDLSLQNWYPGNDYPFGYLLSSRADAAAAVAAGAWAGGVDVETIAAAERHAYGWYTWLKEREPRGRPDFLTLDREVLGTAQGLSKLPYVRDTRRSIGLDGFVLAAAHLRGDAEALTGTRFSDRIAIGSYAVDIHPLSTCELPPYVVDNHDEPLPFYIPFRSLTNRDVENLLVAGKTMAQSFVANAAIRLQPLEWSTGIGAGAAAAHMSARGQSSRQALVDLDAVQERIRVHAPLEWTIGNEAFPRLDEAAVPVALEVPCPAGATFDHGYGFCADEAHVWGPFPDAMVEACERAGGGAACHEVFEIDIGGVILEVPRWSRSFARALRGGGDCPRGTERVSTLHNHCVERLAEGGENVYGPFGAELAARCEEAGGGDACRIQRWSVAIFRHVTRSP